MRKGFGLLEILIVVAIIAFLFAGGGLYLRRLTQDQTIIQTGQNATDKANALKKIIDERSANEQYQIDTLDKLQRMPIFHPTSSPQ